MKTAKLTFELNFTLEHPTHVGEVNKAVVTKMQQELLRIMHYHLGQALEPTQLPVIQSGIVIT